MWICSTVSPAMRATVASSRPAAIQRLIAVCRRSCVDSWGRRRRSGPPCRRRCRGRGGRCGSRAACPRRCRPRSHSRRQALLELLGLVPLEHRDEVGVQVDLALAGSQTPPCGLEGSTRRRSLPPALLPRELSLDVNRPGGEVEVAPDQPEALPAAGRPCRRRSRSGSSCSGARRAEGWRPARRSGTGSGSPASSPRAAPPSPGRRGSRPRSAPG